MESIVIFDGTTYFVEEYNYILNNEEEVVFKGSFESCDRYATNANSKEQKTSWSKK